MRREMRGEIVAGFKTSFRKSSTEFHESIVYLSHDSDQIIYEKWTLKSLDWLADGKAGSSDM
jgi:hypothetical protein